MKIEYKVTLENMKRNRRRTLVTILGVTICVAMLSAIATFVLSFQNAMIAGVTARNGSYEAGFSNLTYEKGKQVIKDENVAESVIFYTDTAQLHGDKTIIRHMNVQGVSQAGLEVKGNRLSQGTFPKRADEIAVSQQFANTLDTPTAIGQQITLDFRQDRKVVETKTYTISGIIDSYYDSGKLSTGIVAFDEKKAKTNGVTAYFTMNSLSGFQDKLDEMQKQYEVQKDGVVTNHDLLQYYGISDTVFLKTILFASSIVVALVLLGGASLIYNSFAISLSQRTRYLGMLSSVGATRRQKRNSIWFEAVCIGVIAFPIGLLVGTGALEFVFQLMKSIILGASESHVELHVVINVYILVVVLLFSTLLLAISAWLPARRASKITAIQAIRQSEDLLISKTSVKTGRFLSKIFGLEGELAMKNIKRNRSRYRATLSSLIICLVLLLSSVTLTGLFQDSMNVRTTTADVEVGISQYGNEALGLRVYDQQDPYLEKFKTMKYVDEAVMTANERYRIEDSKYLSKEGKELIESIYDMKIEDSNSTGTILSSMEVIGLTDEDLTIYGKTIGVDVDKLKKTQSGILVNVPLKTNKGIHKGNWLQPSKDTSTLTLTKEERGEYVGNEVVPAKKDFTMDVVKVTTTTPKALPNVSSYNPEVYLVTSFDTVNSMAKKADAEGCQSFLTYTFLYQSQQSDQLEVELEKQQQDYYIINYAKAQEKNENLMLIIRVFIFGFVGLIIVVCMANIINTMSTGIQLRRREFAMLKSVGITKKQFRRMLSFESLFYGLKTCCYGLPIAFLLMVLLSKIFASGFGNGIYIPWLWIVGSVLCLFGLLFLIGRLSIRKSEQDNIVETIRQESI